MKKTPILLLLFLITFAKSYGLNVSITSSGTMSMASNWSAIATSMGHTVSIVGISTLNDTTFFSGTDILIVSNGRDTFNATQTATMQAFLKSGRSLYVQSENLSTYKSNIACSTIIANLGSTFSWGTSLTGNLTPFVFGSLSLLNDTVVSLPYFRDGCTSSGTVSCGVMPFITDASGNSLGWLYKPTTTSYGRMIFTSDQYWADSGIIYTESVKLMKNIITHLSNKTLGDATPSLQAKITSKLGTSICAGISDTFTATSVNAGASPTYQWKVNGTNVGTSTANYGTSSLVNGDVVTCTITMSTGCLASGTSNAIKMTILANPVAPAITTPVTYCKDIPAIALTATATSATDTLIWYTVATGGTGTKTAIVPSTTTPGSTIYYVSQRNINGCESPRAAITVTVNALPLAPTVTTPPVYCVNATAVALTATATSASDTLKWFTVATGGTGSNTAIVPSTTTAGTISYYVGQKNLLGCEGPRATLTVTTNPLGITPTVTTPVTYCQGYTATALTATKGTATDTLLWYTVATGGTGNKTAPTPSTASAGTTPYYVSGKTNLGCEGARATINVTINASAAAPTTTTPVVYCQGATATALTATPAAGTDTLVWYTVATGGTGTLTAPVPVTTTPGSTSYYVCGRNTIGCEGPRTKITVNINSLPIAPTVTTPPAYCQNAVATALTASTISTSDTLKWYTVATGGTSSNTAITPSTTTAGTFNYYVSQKNILGCEGPRATITVTINPLGTTPTVVTPVAYCLNATPVALTATKGTATDTLLWYTVATGGTGNKTAPTPVTTATGSTPYYVSAKTSFGCEGSRATITVNVNALGGTPTVVTPVLYCQNATAIPLTATKAAATDTLIWYTVATGGTGTQTAPTPVTTTAGSTTYYVSGKNNLGCEGSRAAIVVTINPAGATPTIATPLNYCIGSTAVPLTATAGSSSDTLLWYFAATGGTGTKTAPTPSTATVKDSIFYVSAKTSLGCEGSRAALTVSVNALATAPTVTTPVVYCQNVTASALTATKGSASDTLLWYTVASGGTGTKTAPTPSTTTVGTTNYYVSSKSAKGCESSTRPLIAVRVDTAAGPTTVTTPVIYCQNATGATALTASKSAPTDTLIWYTVATGGTGTKTAPTPSTSTAGNTSYYVTGKNTFGCEGTRSTIVVTINPAGTTPTVVTPVNYCIGATPVALTATAASSSDTLFWYTVATGGTGNKTAPTPVTTPTGTTNYYVSAKTSLGCEGSRATLAVNVNPLAAKPTVTTPVEYCKGTPTVALTATAGAATDTLLWYTIATGGTGTKTAPVPSSAATGTTTYYVSGKTALGCEGSRNALDVVVNPLPVMTISSLSATGTVVCRGGDSVILKVNSATATSYQWSYSRILIPGSIYDTAHANKTGYWTADIKDAKGCKAKDSIYIQVDTSVEPTLTPSETTVCVGTTATLTAHPGFSTYSYKWFKDGVYQSGIPSTTHIINAEGVAIYTVAVTNNKGCTYTTNPAKVDNYPVLPKPSIIDSRPLLSISGPYKYYQWYKNTVEITGAVSSFYTVPSNGSYYVKAIDEYGCFVYSDTIVITGFVGITDPSGNQYGIRIYPNPSQGKVTVESNVPVTVTVMDISGRMLLRQEKATEVDLSRLANGTYLFHISNEQGTLIRTERVQKTDN